MSGGKYQVRVETRVFNVKTVGLRFYSRKESDFPRNAVKNPHLASIRHEGQAVNLAEAAQRGTMLTHCFVPWEHGDLLRPPTCSHLPKCHVALRQYPGASILAEVERVMLPPSPPLSQVDNMGEDAGGLQECRSTSSLGFLIQSKIDHEAHLYNPCP